MGNDFSEMVFCLGNIVTYRPKTCEIAYCSKSQCVVRLCLKENSRITYKNNLQVYNKKKSNNELLGGIQY